MGRVGVERVEGWGMAVGSTGRVVRPHSIDQLRAALVEARAEGTTLAPRGTGCSYGDASTSRTGCAGKLDRGALGTGAHAKDRPDQKALTRAHAEDAASRGRY